MKRKNYLDNIRWLTIVLVVIFHVFYYYNNIGIEAMFAGVNEYKGQITFAGLYQYFVYPWFMVLLFVVAGMSARFALADRTQKQFLRSRTDKLLVPSTLGVLGFGWIGGYVIYIHNAGVNAPEQMPGFVAVIITLCCGIGALWFCHVLFIASLLLLFIRKIIKCFHGTDELICEWFESKADSTGKFCILLFALYLIFWGGSHVLNMPLITAYRNGIYIPAFLAGYYIFSNEKIIEKLKKMILPLSVFGIAAFLFYVYRCYGLAYSDVVVLKRWDVNLYAFLMVLLVLGAGAACLDFQNTFTAYMKKCCFGIYVLHIPVLLVTNYFLEKARIPILRYWILGIRNH